jgi:hypothetical protein
MKKSLRIRLQHHTALFEGLYRRSYGQVTPPNMAPYVATGYAGKKVWGREHFRGALA